MFGAKRDDGCYIQGCVRGHALSSTNIDETWSTHLGNIKGKRTDEIGSGTSGREDFFLRNISHFCLSRTCIFGFRSS